MYNGLGHFYLYLERLTRAFAIVFGPVDPSFDFFAVVAPVSVFAVWPFIFTHRSFFFD